MRRLHELSDSDRVFRADFEAGRIAPGAFDHHAHLRLAYAYLVEHDAEAALELVRASLHRFITVNGIDPGKYHETLTRAWLMAVRHFMDRGTASSSADEFLSAHPQLLDAAIMQSHYSKARLFSAEARQHYVPPDLEPIP